MSAIYRGRAIITGGAGGMGRITARLLLKKGASVILVDISEAVLAEVATTLNAGGRVVTLCSNLSDFDACLAAFHAACTPVHALIILRAFHFPTRTILPMRAYSTLLSRRTRALLISWLGH